MKAIGNNIVLKCVPVEKQIEKKTEAGVIIPAAYNDNAVGQLINTPDKKGKIRVRPYIYSIGSAIDTEKYDLKIGDEVVANDYDVQTQGDDKGNIYAICRVESIKAVIGKE